jgi:hypothetical protein
MTRAQRTFTVIQLIAHDDHDGNPPKELYLLQPVNGSEKTFVHEDDSILSTLGMNPYPLMVHITDQDYDNYKLLPYFTPEEIAYWASESSSSTEGER